MDQPRILMCPPDYFGIDYEINPWMNRTLGSDPRRARRQWLTLRNTLADLGARIEELEPVAGLPDLVFTANAGLVFHGLFVASRFRFGVRQGEEPLFTRWARRDGFDVVALPAGNVPRRGGRRALLRGNPVRGLSHSKRRCAVIIGSPTGSASKSCRWNWSTRDFIISTPVFAP